MDDPNYIKELFNVLKNESRLLILQAIANGRYSVSKLQKELRKAGHRHSQFTIIKEEYLHPLMAAGLAAEARDEYYTTTFGNRLTEVLGCFPELAAKLPAHSECYEETLIQSLLSVPKTFDARQLLILPTLALPNPQTPACSRACRETPEARDYVFFIKSKETPAKKP